MIRPLFKFKTDIGEAWSSNLIEYKNVFTADNDRCLALLVLRSLTTVLLRAIAVIRLTAAN